MKGHPGYQGDHTDYCVDIINRVGSPNLKLLFDIYHVQIMDGDIIRRIRQLKDTIGHVHTAGNPGRGELDDKQEIAYRPIMEALVEIGYNGYVGQEFIPDPRPAGRPPPGRDPLRRLIVPPRPLHEGSPSLLKGRRASTRQTDHAHPLFQRVDRGPSPMTRARPFAFPRRPPPGDRPVDDLRGRAGRVQPRHPADPLGELLPLPRPRQGSSEGRAPPRRPPGRAGQGGVRPRTARRERGRRPDLQRRPRRGHAPARVDQDTLPRPEGLAQALGPGGGQIPGPLGLRADPEAGRPAGQGPRLGQESHRRLHPIDARVSGAQALARGRQADAPPTPQPGPDRPPADDRGGPGLRGRPLAQGL